MMASNHWLHPGLNLQLNYPWLKSTLTVLLSKNDCHQLARHVELPKYQLDAIINSDSSAKDLLDILEERGVIHTSNVSRLLEAISVLKINEKALLMLERYQRSRGDETSYGRFLVDLSSHLLLSLPRKLCDYFKFTNEKKKAVITSQTPGISFLLTLEDMGVINPFDVGKLVTPLKQYQLVQAVAKVQEYQTLVDERSELKKPIHTLEGKQTLFIECLRKKTKSWYETMTPLPWKKSCKWMTSELFIACGLVLTDSKSKMKTTDVDQECKLKYTDILTHRRLKSATRIIIEGDPGSGKTMLSSQLAYDWSIGKSSDARMIVFLPLKFVDGMTIIKAIKQFYIPKGKPLNEGDIKAILDQASDENKTCIVLDGLEEYNGRTKDGEPSEVERVMRKEKFPNCTVVLTSRSDFVHDLPQCQMLKLGRFGEEERDQYIANIIPDDRGKQQNVKCSIETSALLFDLCSNPLLFVYIVHNIEHLGQIDKPKGQLDSVGPFMEVMVNTLLSLSRSEHSESSESEIMSKRLSEIAFNGLCKGYQQLMWQKSFLNENVSNVKDWIESGILVVEEGLMARKEEHQNKGEAVEEEMVTQDEIISIEDERREGESSFEAAMIGEGQEDILSIDEECPRDRESSSDNKLNEKEKPFTEMKTSTDLQNLSLQVKFLHKVIQEWFAAKHFSSMLQRSKGQNRHRLFLDRHLPLINPADLHYVLRFTSYLCPENCYLIMEHLHSCYKSPKGVVPEYILNCIFLCFIECNSSVQNKRMDNAVRQVCKNIVTIRGEDSRILQQSKVSMLMYASNSKIRIGTLRLVDLVVEVTKATLTFNSNITLECFPTLKVIEVSRWDMRLKEEDFEELIKFITQCKLLNKAFLRFPSLPPLLTDKKLLSSMKKDLTIDWIIGERIVHTLDKKSGEWLMQFSSTPHRITDQVLSNSLRVMLMINKEGGRLDIPDTGVSLEIPSGALEGEQLIQMIIIPHRFESESLTFASNSSLVVELLPSNLNLLKPAILTLPHCLVLKKGCEWKAKIYRSHHKEGSEPQWEEQSNTHYKLGEHNCVIEIQRFSWKKFVVLDKIVEAKNIIVFVAGRRGLTDSMLLDIGYYWDLATCEKVSELNNSKLLYKKPTVFYNDGKHLKISLKKFAPMNWTCRSGEKKTQAISFDEVAIAPWSFRTFALDKTEPKGTDACICYCKSGQAPNLWDFIFQLMAPDPSSFKQPSTSKRQEDERVGTSTAGIEAPDLVVTTDTIEDLYDKFCREWKTVGRKRNIGEPKLQAIDKDNQDAQEKVYQMLLTLKQSKGNKASYRLLGEAIEAAGLQDLQQYLYKQDLRDQQIKIKHSNEDRERSSSKYHLQQKDLEDREKKRVSRKMERAKHKHNEVKRESTSPQMERAKHKHHEVKRESTSLQMERAKYKHHDVKRESTSPQMERAKHKHHEVKRESTSPLMESAKHKHHEVKRESTSPQMERAKHKHHEVKRESTSPQIKRTKQNLLDNKKKEHQSEEEEDKAQMQFRSTLHQTTDVSQPGPSKSSAHSGKKAEERTLTPKSGQKQHTEEPESITTKKKNVNTGSQQKVQTPQITKDSKIFTQEETAYQVLSKSLRVRMMINKEGGRLDIPNTGVSLEIPSGALEGEQLIQMKIIPHHLESESLTFASNSSLVVELLPSNLNLLNPAILTLPHCLVLKKGCEWKAKIYRSHHKEGSEPQWEEQSNTHYKLGEHNCVIEIQRFSWEKFVVLDKIVEAKNIIVYAAGRCGLTDSMLLDIGYYWDLAPCEKVSEMNNAKLLYKKPTVFYNDGKHLKISLKKFTPMNWTCSRGEKKTQVISFEKVAINKGTFCTFELNKTEPKGTGTCKCHFKAGQAPNLEDYTFLLKAPDPSRQPSTSNSQEAVIVGTSTAGIEAPDLVVATATIQDLSHKFCDEWRIVGSKLGIGEPKLQTIDTDNRTAQEKVYQMLLTWKQSKGNEATYRLLGEALQSAGRKDLQEYLYQQGGHHSEQRHGDNLQEGRRSIEEPIHQDERPSEVERTPREPHVGSDGLSTSSDLRDQQIKIKHKNEDRERSSSKYHLEQKDVEDRETKRVSRKRKREKHKHHEVKRKSNSPQRKRAKHKHHKEKRKSTSPQRKRAKQYQPDNREKEHQLEEDKGQASWRQEKEHQSTDEEDKAKTS